MSYTELESGYQDLRHQRPGFYVGHDGNVIPIERGDIDMCGDQNDGMDSDCSVSSNSGKQVIVGICAMSKKTQSKPMKEILTRLQEFEYIRMVVFLEDVILKEPVESWPVCDCLISFHSKGFPLEKAIQYAQLRKPYVINNLHMQFDIQDRRRVYAILENEGIEIPRYAVLDRDSPDPKQHELVESEDHVEVNGITFNKPFVEKPVSAEDHNIYIYYPTSAGGGSQRLFRKIGSRSSVYSPESRVRKTGSFIYEDFMPTDGTDVKVYTVGPDYAHAEARKSPALDGKVERDSEGKEIRYPVILNNAEKLISRKVCLAFKQTVCGFDLLRANGKSYVCDVNGFSFVKNSNKYYDDCAKILGNMILRELTPTLHIPWSVPFQLDDPPIVPTTFGKMMELRCVVAVIRHGDRTPKQKMKVEVRHPKFFEIFEKYDGYKHGHVKLKRPKQLQEILDIARSLLAEIQTKVADSAIEEKQGKLEQLKSVLEMYGHFSGINRKVQMKYQPKGRPRGSSSDDGNNSSGNVPKEPSLVLILKWGGELTPAGRIQAEELGRIFRCMYPGGQGRHDYSGTQGLGLLRLHSTFRHDLKIYASDEGRVQMTAAAFAKGLLALEGELTPILVQMVKSANTNGLLDNDCDSSKYQNMAKNRLHELMQIDRDFTKEDRDAINPGNSISINQALDFVKNPVKCCHHVHSLIQSLLNIVNIKNEDPKTKGAILYHGETWDLMARRWGKIEKDFSTKSKQFDISKIPDIYDCIKYDLQHNQHTLQFELAEELYIYAKYLADIVIPQEYGLTIPEKLTIGQGICTPLLKKIKSDLQRNIEETNESVNRLNPRYSHGVSSPGRHVRTRLYFTSESHVHSLLTVLRFGGLLNVLTDEQWKRAMEYISMVSELNYMSQIVIMLYEDPTKDPCSEERFHVELHFSPGVNCCVQKNLPPGPGFRPHSRNDSAQSKNISPDDVNPARIDEENDLTLEESPLSISKSSSEQPSPEEPTEVCALPKVIRSRHLKTSKPITIGSHHTVSGHEASDLAKRLSEELACQQATKQIGVLFRPLSPDQEPRSHSYEQQHPKCKDDDNIGNFKSFPTNFRVSGCTTLYRIDSATNELPLYEIDFSINPLTPDSLLPINNSNDFHNGDPLFQYTQRHRISPLATNERPLSYTCLTSIGVDDVIPECRKKMSVSLDDPIPLNKISIRKESFHRRKLIASASLDQLHQAYAIYHANTNKFQETFHLSCSAPANLVNTNEIDSLECVLTTPSVDVFPEKLQKSLIPQANTSCNTKVENLSKIPPNKSCNPLPFFNKEKSVSDSLISNTTLVTSQSQFDNIVLVPNPAPIPLRIRKIRMVPLAPKSEKAKILITINTPHPDDRTDCNEVPHSTSVDILDAYCSICNNQLISNCCQSDEQNSCYCTNPINRKNPIVTSDTSINITKNVNTCHHPRQHLHNPQPPPENATSSTSVSTSTSGRRQRHSIAGQMSYYKMLGFGGFGKNKMTTSANSLFSTAVISGSSSAPNLRDMIPCTATPSAVLEGFGGVPPIRPLETLHNALSLKQLDGFLEKMTTAQLFKTPASSPPKYPSTPSATPVQTPQNSAPDRHPAPLYSWSGQSSMASSVGYPSSEGPSSPIVSDHFSRGCSSSEISTSASLISTDGNSILPTAEELAKYFPKLDEDLNAVCTQISDVDVFQGSISEKDEDISCITPISELNTAAATKGSTASAATEISNDDDDEATLSVDTCFDESNNVLQLDVSPLTNEVATKIHASEQFFFPRVQKQISLYEAELVSSAEFTKIKSSSCCPNRSNTRRRKFETIGVSFLTQSASNDCISQSQIRRLSQTSAHQVDSSQSCLNLKQATSEIASSAANGPGTILVKEMLIDPSKILYASECNNISRHGSCNDSEMAAEASVSETNSASSLTTIGRRRRFVTTKVFEPEDNK